MLPQVAFQGQLQVCCRCNVCTCFLCSLCVRAPEHNPGELVFHACRLHLCHLCVSLLCPCVVYFRLFGHLVNRHIAFCMLHVHNLRVELQWQDTVWATCVLCFTLYRSGCLLATSHASLLLSANSVCWRNWHDFQLLQCTVSLYKLCTFICWFHPILFIFLMLLDICQLPLHHLHLLPLHLYEQHWSAAGSA